MYKIIEYTILFISLWLLQILLMDNLNLSVYAVPLIYVAMIVLLPTDINGGVLLLTAFVVGAAVDISSGNAGLNTIALVATAFCRPMIISLTLGHDEVKDSVVPTSSRIGVGKFLRYSIMLVAVNSIVYFCFETLTLSYFYLTALRIVLSTIVTSAFVFVIQLLFSTVRE